MIRRTGRRQAQCGAAMIEFAITGIALMLLMLGCIELDRLVLVRTSMANAAEEGVRYASVQAAQDITGVQTTVKNYATGVNTSAMTVTVTYSAGDNGQTAGNPGSKVKVQATYAYDPLVATILPSGLTVTAVAQGIIVY
ncbi:MAG TPA: TadE/TadG family type IV pilus assembly protein [Candidatus Sulfopaludibacter sp.]|nr:TadE/TadG family type IV pilus assembly protein [Candidatus Sulfopaludibacter sp.]